MVAAIGVTGAVVLVAFALSNASGTGRVATGEPASGASAMPVIDVSATGCAAGWRAPRSGRRSFQVENGTNAPYDVDLVGADQQTVYAEIEMLAPHTQRPLPATLPPGRYSWRCTRVDGLVTFSAEASVTGPNVSGAHPYVPVTYTQLSTATVAYRAAVSRAMQVLVARTGQLRVAVDGGRLDAARSSWLAAHMQYERLGAAYGTFGDFDSEINGRANGRPNGTRDARFTGFHRLELGLWKAGVDAAGVAALAPVADALDHDVRALVAAFPHLQTPPNDVALRTHEILENALQFELTGETDYGSHTNLATVRANVDGTVMTLTAIAPLLKTRDPALLSRATEGLRELASSLDRYGVGGAWTPVEQLSRSGREHLDAELSGLLEQLSPIPDLLELPKDADDS